MAVQALYRKWRSQSFDELIGQEHVTTTLRNALGDGRIAHAYLFAGPRGTGKTSTARLLAKAVNCQEEDLRQRPDNTCPICRAINDGALLDLIEIDAASNRGIDEIRDLRDKVHFRPSQARYKVYVIDEVHMLTPEAFNALLKTLEEPPPHVIFVLATTEPHRIPDTVLSRCQRFDFHRIPTSQIVQRLDFILQQEGRSARPGALEMIARSAEGSMRDAISLVDQLLSYGDDAITETQVQAVRGVVPGQAVIKLVDHLVAIDAGAGLALINQLAAEGIDLRQLAIQAVAYLRAVLVNRVSGQEARAILADFPDDQLARVQEHAAQMNVAWVSSALRLLNQASQDMRDAAHPQLVLELAWLDALDARLAQESAGQKPAQTGAIPPIVERRLVAPDDPLPSPAAEPLADTQAVETLRSNWTWFLQAAESARGPQLRGALRTLRNVVAAGDDIYLAFEHDFAKTFVERPANKATVQQLLTQLLGRSLRVHCQVGTHVTGVPAQMQPAAPGLARASEPGQDFGDDPLVQHAREHLGAVPGDVTGSPSAST